MKYLPFAAVILAIFLSGCKGNATQQELARHTSVSGNLKSGDTLSDKKAIQSLIRKMLNWSHSKNNLDIDPTLTDSANSLCIAFDLKKMQQNADQLKATGFFSKEFIDNYKHIILTLDRELKNKDFNKWSTGELPPYNFANDVDPWSDCQDVPYDKPNPWDLVEVHIVNLTQTDGNMYWTWGRLDLNSSPDWKAFAYKFRVKKEGGNWKISYLDGFDYKSSIGYVK